MSTEPITPAARAAVEALLDGPVSRTEEAAASDAVRFVLDGLDVASLAELALLVEQGKEARDLGDRVRDGRALVAIFDTRDLDPTERDCLAGEVAVQGESVTYGGGVGHPSVPVAVL